MRMFIATLPIIAKTYKIIKHPPAVEWINCSLFMQNSVQLENDWSSPHRSMINLTSTMFSKMRHRLAYTVMCVIYKKHKRGKIIYSMQLNVRTVVSDEKRATEVKEFVLRFGWYYTGCSVCGNALPEWYASNARPFLSFKFLKSEYIS
jgi:hypothetical protein